MYRAYDAERERVVAVKALKLDLPPERVHQLVAALDALIVAELSHPAIVLPLGTGISDVTAYLAQEYVAAESLDQALREYGPAPAGDAVRVAAQLASALDFAAVVNVTHGSLHPRDVLISAAETRLTGIGIARALEIVGVAAPVRRPYSAPERVAGASWDRRADIFSLAALIHELMWGRRITGTGGHAADALTAVEGGDLRALQDVFARALAEDPRDRFDTALEFAEALKASFSDVAIASRAATARPRAAERPSEQPAAPRLPLGEADAVAALPLRESDEKPDLVIARESADRPEPVEPVERLGAVDRLEHVNRLEHTARLEPIEPLAFGPAVERYQDVEPVSEPSSPEVHVRDDFEHLSERETGAREMTVPEPPPISVLERSRSAVWPLMASLAIGLAVGFASGYGVASRDHGAQPVTTQAALESSTPAAAPPAGRDATEVAVAADAKTAVPKTAVPVPTDASPTAPARESAAASAVRPAPSSARTSAATPTATTPADRGARARGAAETGARPSAAPDRSARPAPGRSAADAAPRSDRTAPPVRARESVNASRTPARPAERPAAAAASGTAGRFVGSLYVASRPDGARVFLDGKLIGTTPLEMQSVPAGEHAVRLEREGYRRWSSSVRVVASERNRVTASLER